MFVKTIHGAMPLLQNTETIEESKELMDNWMRYLAIVKQVDVKGECSIPKCHQFTRIIHNSGWHGNPKFCACWVDEALNKELKSTLRLCHAACFERMGFHKFAHVLRNFEGKRLSPG